MDIYNFLSVVCSNILSFLFMVLQELPECPWWAEGLHVWVLALRSAVICLLGKRMPSLRWGRQKTSSRPNPQIGLNKYFVIEQKKDKDIYIYIYIYTCWIYGCPCSLMLDTAADIHIYKYTYLYINIHTYVNKYRQTNEQTIYLSVARQMCHILGARTVASMPESSSCNRAAGRWIWCSRRWLPICMRSTYLVVAPNRTTLRGSSHRSFGMPGIWSGTIWFITCLFLWAHAHMAW